MNNEYIEFVKSRAKGGDAILVSLTPEKCHLLHMAIGISGEAAEFYDAYIGNGKTVDEIRKNMREEAGDLLFYITGATFALPSWTMDDAMEAFSQVYSDKYNYLDCIQAVVVAAGDFLDLVKKYTVYNKPFDEQKIKESLIEVLYQLGTYYPDDIKDLMNENMTKLLKRYANGYTDKAAQERADKKEGE